MTQRREINSESDWQRVYEEALDDLGHFVMEMVADGEIRFEGDPQAVAVLHGVIRRAEIARTRQEEYREWREEADTAWGGLSF